MTTPKDRLESLENDEELQTERLKINKGGKVHSMECACANAMFELCKPC